MSIRVKLESLPDERRVQLVNDLSIHYRPSPTAQPKTLEIYDIDGDDVYLPLGYAKSKGINNHEKITYKPLTLEFVGGLRDAQVVVKNEAISALNSSNCVIISCYPGFGKTRSAIYLATRIKLQTLVIINLLVLKEQWINSIKELCPSATVAFIEPSKKNNNFEADFLIVNAINVKKFGRDAFKTVGNVIVDEVHLIMSEVLSQSLYYITPKYLIGLSATPYRQDGMDALLELFFGSIRIIRKMERKHTVYKITTDYTPEVEYDRMGKIIWNSIIDFQSNHQERNDKIIRTIIEYPTRNFLVLTKRVGQAKYIHEKLAEEGQHSTLYIESNTTFDKDARILVGTIKKLGVGFDHSKLDTLIAGCDLESYFIQYLGRIFRSPDGVEPIVFDIVDNNTTLKRHYKTREKVYRESGGAIVQSNFSE